MTEIKILTTYISYWGWTIISMIFICSGALFLADDNNTTDLALFSIFIIMSIYCFYMGIKRKKEVLGDEQTR